MTQYARPSKPVTAWDTRLHNTDSSTYAAYSTEIKEGDVGVEGVYNKMGYYEVPVPFVYCTVIKDGDVGVEVV